MDCTRLPRWRGFNLTEKFTGKHNRPFLESDFAWMAELGFDFARLAMSYRCWTTPAGWRRADEKTLGEIDQAVQWGRQYGVHVCVNLHRIPGFCVNDIEPDPFDLFRDQEALDAAAWQWRLFAERWKGVPNERLSFNLFNEPIRPEPAAHLRVVTHLVRTIREVDPERLIIADGTQWARRPVHDFVPLRIAQAMHLYDPIQVCFWHWEGLPDSLAWPAPTWPMTVASPDPNWNGRWDKERLRRQCFAPWKELVAKGVGVHVSELGCWKRTPHAAAVAWLADAAALFRESGWGYALWNFRGPFGILDSERDDCRYEDCHGHQLDRALYEVLKSDGEEGQARPK
jgi:endoglucanase